MNENRPLNTDEKWAIAAVAIGCAVLVIKIIWGWIEKIS